jgi:hypothetical protein
MAKKKKPQAKVQKAKRATAKKQRPMAAAKRPAAKPAKKARPVAASAKPAAGGSKPAMRSSWLDEASNTPVIEKQARRLNSFLEAMADGKIDDHEIVAQEARLVKLMKEVEPTLDAATHAKVTQLLCELTAYDLMQVLHSMEMARPKTVFQG